MTQRFSTDWETWDCVTWSLALFDHFFVRGDSGTPVSRLVMTPGELAKVVGNVREGQVTAKDAFLSAIRMSPRKFRRTLSLASLSDASWDKRNPPPFLSQLLFTCYAAASLDSDTLTEGEFRERLRILLGHPEGSTYGLADLPRLWEALSEWLHQSRDKGLPYRSLVLPDPGGMTLIGYSMRLAFPSRRDRSRLEALLRNRDDDAVPTVPEALQLLGRQIRHFSRPFREAFARARTGYAQGTHSAELEALWSAVLDATLLTGPSQPHDDERARFQLFLQEDDVANADPFLVASARPPFLGSNVSLTRLEEPLGEYRWLVSRTQDRNTTAVSEMVLRGRLGDVIPGLHGSSVTRSVEQGLLMFLRKDDSTWELVESRPEEGIARALVSTRMASGFLKLLQGGATRPRPSRFSGWLDVGPFELADLAEPDLTLTGLGGIRCLQRTSVGLQLRLSGGVRVDDGLLGTPGLLPEARCLGADDLRVFEVADGPEGIVTRLMSVMQRQTDTGSFRFADGHAPLEGVFNFVASAGGQVTASREVTFHSRVLAHDYGRPSDLDSWFIEALSTDISTPEAADDWSAASSSEKGWVRDRAFPRRSSLAFDDSVDQAVWMNHDRSMDTAPVLGQLAEAIAAISLRRKGIGEPVLLDLIKRSFGASVEPGVWDAVRAWLEAGYLDVLSRRHWRGRVYFARRPRLIVTKGGVHPHLTLVGTAPHALRARARIVFRDLQAVSLPAGSVSPFVGGPPRWSVESIEVAHTAARQLELGQVGFATGGVKLPPLLAVATRASFDFGPGYELRGSWDWARGGFRSPPSREPKSSVRVEWHSRHDRPDVYTVIAGDGRQWSTRARNWALLVGYSWAGQQAFEARGQTAIVRIKPFGPYVPLAIARAVSLQSGVLSGPIQANENEFLYSYRFESVQSRDRVLGWLRGEVNAGDVRRRLTWILGALGSHRGKEKTSAVPLDLRRRLRLLDHIPEARLVSSTHVPRRLLPHLRRTVDLAGV